MRAVLAALSAIVLAGCGGPRYETSGQLGPHAAGCETREAFREMGLAASNGDRAQFDALLGGPCYLVGGWRYSIIDRRAMTAQVRVYMNSSSRALWVAVEDLEPA